MSEIIPIKVDSATGGLAQYVPGDTLPTYVMPLALVDDATLALLQKQNDEIIMAGRCADSIRGFELR